MMRKLLVLALASVMLLSACHTVRGAVHGIGKDTAAAGTWIQEKVPADQNQPYAQQPVEQQPVQQY